MRLLRFFLLSPLSRRGTGVQKIAGKIRSLRRDVLLDYPLKILYILVCAVFQFPLTLIYLVYGLIAIKSFQKLVKISSP